MKTSQHRSNEAKSGGTEIDTNLPNKTNESDSSTNESHANDKTDSVVNNNFTR